MEPWSQFEGQSYLSLETFKKSGQGVVLVDAAEAAQAEPLLNRKYGLLKRGFDLMGKVNRSVYVTIRIVPRHADT